MRIAVILESCFDAGGGFHQELRTACLLNKQKGRRQFIFYTTERSNIEILKAHGIFAKYLDRHSLRNRVYLFCSQSSLGKKLLSRIGFSVFPIEVTLVRDGIDLVYFLAPSFLVVFMTRINYVMTLWDLCHRDHPEFPEANFGGEFEGREYIYKNALQKAVAILVDSDLGKVNVVRRYGCDQERVYVARFLPSLDLDNNDSVDIKAKYDLRRPYVFYPAQFWSHKNHVYILDGLKVLREKYGIAIDAVFSGSDKGNLNYVLGYARKLGLADQVHYIGFVPGGEMASLYKQALALVMPTYFGPTNIPPFEAFSVGCPVCYSDLPGLREQVGDAAFLMDLADPETLARHVMTILNNPSVVLEKVQRGKILLSQWTEDDYGRVLSGIFDQYARKMKCWKADD